MLSSKFGKKKPKKLSKACTLAVTFFHKRHMSSLLCNCRCEASNNETVAKIDEPNSRLSGYSWVGSGSASNALKPPKPPVCSPGSRSNSAAPKRCRSPPPCLIRSVVVHNWHLDILFPSSVLRHGGWVGNLEARARSGVGESGEG